MTKSSTAKQDKERRKQFERHYKTFYDGKKCYYCGDLATTVDHVPAVKVAFGYGMDEITRRKIKLVTVKACRQCNSILGTKGITLDERARIVYKALQRRYKRVLSSEQWEDSELDELEGRLRDYVIAFHYTQTWVENRLQYMEDIFYDVLVEDNE